MEYVDLSKDELLSKILELEEDLSNCQDNRMKLFELEEKRCCESGFLNAVAELKISQSKLLSALDTITDAIFISDLKGDFVEFNEAFATFHRLKDKTECFKKLDEWKNIIALYNLDGSLVPDKLWSVPRALRGETESNVEYVVERKDTGERWYASYNFSPIRDAKGTIIGSVVIGRDLSERKKAEKDIVETKQFYEEIIEGVQDGIWVTNEKDVIFFANSAMEKIAGIPREIIQGKNVLKDFSDDTTGELIPFYNRAKREKKPVWYDIRVKTPAGTDTWQNGWLIPKYENDSFHGITCTIRDVSERKQTEKEVLVAKERAEESNKLKSAFLANMSHEIRTPMNGIMGFTSLLKEPDLSGEEQQFYISIIEKSGGRMLRTIQNIIDISRIESGQVIVSKTEINVNHEIDELITFFIPEAKIKNTLLLVTEHLNDQHAMIFSDIYMLNSILTNLIKNAIKFTPDGQINVGCSLKNTNGQNELEFYVKDTGIGIPDERQMAIFERFVQADVEQALASEGTGLGLAISRAYVEMLGGTIWLESKEGVGSSFYFKIPYATDPQNLS